MAPARFVISVKDLQRLGPAAIEILHEMTYACEHCRGNPSARSCSTICKRIAGFKAEVAEAAARWEATPQAPRWHKLRIASEPRGKPFPFAMRCACGWWDYASSPRTAVTRHRNHVRAATADYST